MSKAASAREKFAELRALRASGKKRLDSYEVHQEDDLYEEVDEDGYKKVVRERLNQDDFVIDDNGEGYADDGREEWDRRPGYDTESEDDLPVKGKSGKSGKPDRTNIIPENVLTLFQPNGNVRKTRLRRSRWTRESATISPRVLLPPPSRRRRYNLRIFSDDNLTNNSSRPSKLKKMMIFWPIYLVKLKPISLARVPCTPGRIGSKINDELVLCPLP